MDVDNVVVDDDDDDDEGSREREGEMRRNGVVRAEEEKGVVCE